MGRHRPVTGGPRRPTRRYDEQPHVRRHHGRRWRDPTPSAEPARAPEALPAAARRRVPAPGHRATAAPPDRRHHDRHRPPLRADRPRPGARRRAPARADGPQHGRRDRPGDDRPRPAGRGRHARRPRRRPHRPRARGRCTRDVLASRPSTSPPARSVSRTRSSPSAPQVTHPATQYGYLLPDSARRDIGDVDGLMRAYPLAAFEEKPSPERAEDLFEDGGRRLERRHLPLAAPGDHARRSAGTPACSRRSAR